MVSEHVSVVDLSAQYNELSAIATEALQDEFGALGLSLQRLYINAITLPADAS